MRLTDIDLTYRLWRRRHSIRNLPPRLFPLRTGSLVGWQGEMRLPIYRENNHEFEPALIGHLRFMTELRTPVTTTAGVRRLTVPCSKTTGQESCALMTGKAVVGGIDSDKSATGMVN